MTTTTARKPRRTKSLPPTPAWEQYCDAVLSGVRPAGELVRLAVQRHRRDLAEGAARGLWFDAEAARHAIDFYGFLCHSKGEWAGRPFELADWQQFIVAMVFGWMRADGTRRFREAYIEIPRKNGKSTMTSGFGLYCLFADGELGADVYAAATKRAQARIVHEEAVKMVKASPSLRSRIGVMVDNLHVVRTNSKFEPLGADDNTADGLNVHAALIDEYHAHPTSGMFDVLNTATGARRQPLIIVITTAGSNKAKSPCGQKNEYCQRVLLGTVDNDEVFAFIATIDKGDDWRDEKVWAKANPNLGTSCKLDDLRRKARSAQEILSEQNTFRRLHLNEWTEQTSRWLDLETWDKCRGSIDALDFPHELQGRVCFGGLDLSATKDITAFVLWFPPTDEDPVGYTIPYCFIPAENMTERDRKDRTTYGAWVSNEYMHSTSGNVVDYAHIRAAVHEAAERFQLQQVAYDRYNSSQIVTELTGDGIDMVPWGQGYVSMSAPTKSLETHVLKKSLAHGGHPVLRWMAQNVSIAQDPAGNIKPDKKTSGEKIDGIVALVMAIGISELQPTSESAYENYELRELD